MDKAQYEKAIKEYLKLVNANLLDARDLLQLASCYESANNSLEASKTYIKVYEIYREDGAYQKAVAVLKQAQRLDPDSDDIVMNLAELYSALALPHEAVNQLERSLARAEKENNKRTYAKLIQTMVRVDAENVEMRLKYAQMLHQDGDVEGAGRQYSLSLAQLLSKERFAEYIKIAHEYLKLYPKDFTVIQSLANIYLRMKRPGDALSLLSTVSPDDRTPELHEALVTCFERLNRRFDAVAELKRLARKYEQIGSPEDLIESVWLRAQKLNPNDPDVQEALGDDDVPLLSDSALESIVPSEMSGSRGTQRRDESKPKDAAQLSQLLTSKYNEAVNYYNRGNAMAAEDLCKQIIASNEQHLPALQLLAKIYDASKNLFSLAQIERKLARAVHEDNLDEAVRHVLKAEQCTPHAWENFNLMLVFGLDPASYGMQPPRDSGTSNPRISLSQMNAAPPRMPNRPPSPPPVNAGPYRNGMPSAANMQPAMPPRPVSAPPPLPAARPAQSVPPTFSPISARPNAAPNRMQSPARVAPRAMNPSGNFPNARAPIPSHTMPGMRPAAPRASQMGRAVFGNIDNATNSDNLKTPPSLPAVEQPSSPSGLHQTLSSAQAHAPFNMRSASHPAISPTAQAAPFSHIPSNPSQSLLVPNGAPSDAATPPQPMHAVEPPAAIPPSDYNTVQEAIQEIDFYASLALVDDAKKKLSELIEKYGDIDIIHDAKIRLGFD